MSSFVRPGACSPLYAIGVGHALASRTFVGKLGPPSVAVSNPPGLSPSCARGVGHEEEPLAEVRGADVGGGDDAAVHAIPGGEEVGDNSVQPRSNEPRNVLDDDEPRPKLFDDPRELTPEAGARAVDSFVAVSGDGDVLAGEPAANKVNCSELSASDSRDIFEPLRLRPSFRKHAPTERVDLDLPRDRAEARALQPKVQPADPAEE